MAKALPQKRSPLLGNAPAEHEVLICHGNKPLDDLVAQTQGMVGYWLAQLLSNERITKPIVAVVTQTVVESLLVGSMGTKVEGRRRFVTSTGGLATIGASSATSCPFFVSQPKWLDEPRRA